MSNKQTTIQRWLDDAKKAGTKNNVAIDVLSQMLREAEKPRDLDREFYEQHFRR